MTRGNEFIVFLFAILLLGFIITVILYSAIPNKMDIWTENTKKQISDLKSITIKDDPVPEKIIEKKNGMDENIPNINSDELPWDPDVGQCEIIRGRYRDSDLYRNVMDRRMITIY